MIKTDKEIDFPVVSDVRDFDRKSGNRLERVVFNNRVLMLCICALLTVFLGYHATKLGINASFERMIPISHHYVKNYLENKDQLRGLSNALRVVVENKQGDIYDTDYLKTLAKINDTLYLIPGVERAWLKSMWTPFVMWVAVTETGLEGGPVMPNDFDFSPAAFEQLKLNVSRSSALGTIIAKDLKSSLVYVPLLDYYRDGRPLDYGALGRDIEAQVRSLETDKIKIYVVGFGKLVGDLIEGMGQIVGFLGISVLIATLFVFTHTHCVRSTLLLGSTSVLGVVWLLGLMHLIGYELDPYSILVPFLIFAIGMSHGAQRMNGVMQDVGRGTHEYVAARYTFRRLFLTGLSALLTDILGFAALVIIDIPVIRNMALTTSIGVTVLVFTKLILIPVLLSYTGVSLKAAKRSIAEEERERDVDGLKRQGVISKMWSFLDRFTQRRWASYTLAVAAIVAVGAYVVSLNVQIGDLEAGAPELRPDSRYNRDMDFVTRHFGLTSDQFAVIVKLPPYTCHHYESLVLTERLGTKLKGVEGVLGVSSLAEDTKAYCYGNNEGNPKMRALPNDNVSLGSIFYLIAATIPDAISPDCAAYPVIAYLGDHKAATLDRVLKATESFAAEYNRTDLQFLPAAGSAGIEAITNIVVKESNILMLLVIYSSVLVFCFITFRSWRAVVIAMIPLVITSMLCEAIMVWLGIGIKVATLPVITLGVGVGVDYALYLLGVQLSYQRAGESLAAAYRRSLNFTGRIVALVGITFAASTITWAWSPIKFQADMGILLTFMFLWNMIGALIMIPALSHFLLQTQRGDSP